MVFHFICWQTMCQLLQAQFAMIGLDHKVWLHDTVKYLLISIRINRPMKIVKKNVMDVDKLKKLIHLCDSIYMGKIFKAVFLLAFSDSYICQTSPLILLQHLTLQDIKLLEISYLPLNS